METVNYHSATLDTRSLLPLGSASAVWLFYFCDNILFLLEQAGKQLG